MFNYISSWVLGLMSCHWSSTNSQIIFHKFPLMEFGWMISNWEWVIFYGWYKKFNDISWIWILFHQLNFIFHECMDELQWDNGWPRWNQILIQLRVIIIESWWTSNGWCVSEWHWFIPIHVVYGSKWATITLKTQQPNFFPCFWWIIMCFMKEEKHSLEWEIEKDLDKKEREDKFLEF